MSDMWSSIIERIPSLPGNDTVPPKDDLGAIFRFVVFMYGPHVLLGLFAIFVNALLLISVCTLREQRQKSTVGVVHIAECLTGVTFLLDGVEHSSQIIQDRSYLVNEELPTWLFALRLLAIQSASAWVALANGEKLYAVSHPLHYRARWTMAARRTALISIGATYGSGFAAIRSTIMTGRRFRVIDEGLVAGLYFAALVLNAVAFYLTKGKRDEALVKSVRSAITADEIQRAGRYLHINILIVFSLVVAPKIALAAYFMGIIFLCDRLVHWLPLLYCVYSTIGALNGMFFKLDLRSHTLRLVTCRCSRATIFPALTQTLTTSTRRTTAAGLGERYVVNDEQTRDADAETRV